VALLVNAGTPGFTVSRMIDVLAPHPLGTLTFADCRVPVDAIVGEPGKGMRVALGTLDVFRTTVGAAALGFARRALDEAIAHVKQRVQFGGPSRSSRCQVHRRNGCGHRRGPRCSCTRRVDATARRTRHAEAAMASWAPKPRNR
jgi:alkylation response protein AidB-like acyl-CoA dehydrogenase